ncbi:Uncharacterised protein [Pseudomonas putida]|nr:Uncharacterised protein [Pseudomonas putida]
MGEHHQWPGNHRNRRQHPARCRPQPAGKAGGDHQQGGGGHHAQGDFPVAMTGFGQQLWLGFAVGRADQPGDQCHGDGNRQVQAAAVGKGVGGHGVERQGQQNGPAYAGTAGRIQIADVGRLHRCKAAERTGYCVQGEGGALFQAQEGHHQRGGDGQAGQQSTQQATPAPRSEGDGPHQKRGDDELEVEERHCRRLVRVDCAGGAEGVGMARSSGFMQSVLERRRV